MLQFDNDMILLLYDFTISRIDNFRIDNLTMPNVWYSLLKVLLHIVEKQNITNYEIAKS